MSRNEKWHMNGNEISVTKKYRNLGKDVKPSLDLGEYLARRVNASKMTLNSVWSRFVGMREVSFKDKLHKFGAIARSTVCISWG